MESGVCVERKLRIIRNDSRPAGQRREKDGEGTGAKKLGKRKGPDNFMLLRMESHLSGRMKDARIGDVDCPMSV